MNQVPVSESFTRMCQKIYSEDCTVDASNSALSHIRLGVVLKYMDICACLSVEKIAQSSCVTASMDHLVFSNDQTFSDGDVMMVEAQVVRCFNTSAEVVVRVMTDPSLSRNFSCMQNPKEKEKVCFAHAFFIFVRLDRGKMPVMFPQTGVERQEYGLAMERRRSRQNKMKLLSIARASVHTDGESMVMGIRSDTNNNNTNNNIEDTNASTSSSNTFFLNGEPNVVGVPADRSVLEFTHLVLPTHANHMGNTFGGQIMCWAEEIAVLAATLHVNTALTLPGSVLYKEETTDNPKIAPRWVPVPPLSKLDFATVYVSALSFLSPSTVGDRIHVRAQCCRTYGSLLEIEVTISASDVTAGPAGFIRPINTGHFCVCCREHGVCSRPEPIQEALCGKGHNQEITTDSCSTTGSSGVDVLVPQVIPRTVEQRERYALSLQRMMIASTRASDSNNNSNTNNSHNNNNNNTAGGSSVDSNSSTSNILSVPSISAAASASFHQLSAMMQLQASSIWSSDSIHTGNNATCNNVTGLNCTVNMSDSCGNSTTGSKCDRTNNNNNNNNYYYSSSNAVVSTPMSMSVPVLSPSIEVECSTDLALQDICGLLCALGPSSDSSTLTAAATPTATAAWGESLPIHIPGVSLQVRKSDNNITKLCLRLTVHAPVAAVAGLILDLEKRGDWDNIMSGHVVREIAPDIELVWMGSAMGGVDYALLRCHRELEDGRVAIVSRSVFHPALPPSSSSAVGTVGTVDSCDSNTGSTRAATATAATAAVVYKRGEVLPSGFLLTPIVDMDIDTDTVSDTDAGTVIIADRESQNLASRAAKTSAAVVSGGGGGDRGDTAQEEHKSKAHTTTATSVQYLLQFDSLSAQSFAGELDGRTSQIVSSMLRFKAVLEENIGDRQAVIDKDW